MSGVASYMFGVDGNGVPSSSLNYPGYVWLNNNDTVEWKVRCTTNANKTINIANNAAMHLICSFSHVLNTWTVPLSAQNVILNGTTGNIQIPELNDYILTRNTSTNVWTYIRVTTTGIAGVGSTMTRRLYMPRGTLTDPIQVPLKANDIVDLITFRVNPVSGDTTAPWAVNAAYNFDVQSARSAGITGA